MSETESLITEIEKLLTKGIFHERAYQAVFIILVGGWIYSLLYFNDPRYLMYIMSPVLLLTFAYFKTRLRLQKRLGILWVQRNEHIKSNINGQPDKKTQQKLVSINKKLKSLRLVFVKHEEVSVLE